MPAASARPARALSLLTVVALALQAAGGLFIPGLYRDSTWVSSVLRGQDFVALAIVVPLLLVSHTYAQRGSLRWRLVWLGVLYKVFYNNMYYLVGSSFNRFFLVYVAVFVVSSFAIVAALLDTDPAPVGATPIPPAHRKTVAAILFVEAGVLVVLWVGQSIAFILTGTLPKVVEDTGGGVHLIASLDLTLIVPLLVLGAAWLWRSHAWGHVIAVGMLVQCALITVDLLITPAFQAAAGVADAWAMAPLFAAMALGFFTGAFLLLRKAPASAVSEPALLR